MVVDGLNINSIVNIEYNENNYKCTVQEITDKYIALTLPLNSGGYVIPHLKEEVVVSYFDSSDIYSFYSNVIGRKRDNVPLFLIDIPSKVKKVQRRGYVRVAVILVTNYWNIHNAENLRELERLKNNEKSVKGTILDISGSGCKLLMESDVNINDLIIVELPVENNLVTVLGRVVRVSKDDLERNVIGLKFEGINEATRDKLIKFVFEIMRKQRRKE